MFFGVSFPVVPYRDLSDAEFGKNLTNLSSQFAASANRRL